MTTTLESLQKAYEHHRLGQLDEAERLYRQILTAEPHNVQALHLLGVAAHQRGQYAAAVEHISRAIVLDGSQAAFHMNLAASNLALGRIEPAIAALREVVRLEPQHAKAHNDLGVLLANLGRWEEAAERFRQVLRIQPDYGPAHNNLGNILNQLGRPVEAIACFRAALRAQPDLVQAYNNLGNALKDQGQLDEAVDAYREALRIDPDYVDGYYNLGIALKSRDKADEAIACYREALRIRPDFVEARFNLGNLFKAQGLLPEALEALEIVIDQRPDFSEAHFQLGGVLKALGRAPQARAALAQSIRLKPSLADAHHALGNLLHEQGEIDAAIASFQEALRQHPNFMEAYNNLATTLRDAKRYVEAEQNCRQALAIDPACAEALSNLGLILQDQQRTAEAIGCQREALRLRPDLAAAHNGLGVALESQGDYDAALACLREAVRLQPDFSEAYNNLGGVLKALGKNGEAIVCFEEALRWNADFAEAHNGLGAVLQLSAHPEEALAEYQQALELKPDYAEAHCNVGQLLAEQGKPDAALARYDHAIRLQPTLATVRQNRAITLLLMGDFAAGWPEYEWRLKLSDAPPCPWTQRVWDGSPLEGRAIVLHHEQGLGDTLQCIRYAPLVAARGGRVIVACPKKLVPILGTCSGIERFCTEDDPLPDADLRAPLMSLPGIFKTDLASIPADIPYLSAPPDLVRHWGGKLAGKHRLRVGIHWQGNPIYRGDRFRSFSLAEFAPLAAIQRVRLLSLQKGPGIEQLADAPFAVEDLGSHLDEAGAAFCETAAVIENLDLVITSDSALAHLAGALGANVWLALPFAPDWRWLLDRPDSPWYPTMRLFRQSRPADWGGVFQQIAAELSPLAARPLDRGRFPRRGVAMTVNTVNTKNIAGRRKLHFNTYQDILDDVHALAAQPTRTLGNWSFGQICEHLAAGLNMAIDGAPASLPWYFRLVGPFLKKRVLAGPMSPGFRLPKSAASLLPHETSSADGIAALEKAIERQQHISERKPHMVFGTLTRDEWDQLHMRHAEIHLGFVVPA